MRPKNIDAILWIVALVVGIWVSNKYLGPDKKLAVPPEAVESVQPQKILPATPLTGNRQITKDHVFGTLLKEDHNKMIDYVVQEDEKAFNAALSAGLRAGRMTMFAKGEQVILIDTSIMSGMVKVRRKGKLDEYWIDLEAVASR